MKFTFILLLFIAIPTLSQDRVFGRMDVFELEWVSNPRISPDGNMIVYQRGSMDVMKDRRVSRLWLISRDGKKHQKLTSDDRSESQAVWSPDGTRIAFVTSTDNGSEIFVYWTETAKTARLTQLERSPRNLAWSPDGNHISFTKLVPEAPPSLVKPPKKPDGAEWAKHPRVETRFKHEADGRGYIEPGYSQIFVIPSTGGTPRALTSGKYPISGDHSWSKTGDRIFFVSNRKKDWEYDFRNSEIYSVNTKSLEITALTNRNGPDRSPVVSPDGNTIAYTGYDDKVQTYQVNNLYLMKPDGSGKKIVPLNLDRSIRNIEWEPSGKGIYFLYDDKGNTKLGYTDLKGKVEEVTGNIGGEGVARPYGGGSFSLSSNGWIALNQTRPEYPAELAVMTKGGSPSLLTDLNSDLLDYIDLGEVEEMWYKSSHDERDIQGWIVKPPNFDPSGKYPLLVENHGGPVANYGDRFSPEMQLYASDGYVVFYPNPRGSTSYGEEFGNLLYHNYPGNDYDDVMSGVDELIKRGFIHEDSLFVTGGSAGGIMTAWIIGHNNRFRSAAVVKPIMNWMSKTLVADNYYGYANSRFPGQPWENPEDYLTFSPITYVANITTPTLVMVGTEDRRTPPYEAKMLYHALKLRKIETAFVEVWGSYHFIANRPSQLITKVDHILAWFRKYRKPNEE